MIVSFAVAMWSLFTLGLLLLVAQLAVYDLARRRDWIGPWNFRLESAARTMRDGWTDS
jgi:hypothetical protein